MFYNYYEDYQYDSCVSKGICSIGPRTSSLQEVLIMYLKLLAFYTIELMDFGGHNKDTEKVILSTISILMSNMESETEQFTKALINLKTLLTDSKKTYLKLCKERDIQPKYIQTDIELDSKLDITKLIQQGEKEYTKRTEYLSPERKNLFEVLAFVIKSLCINIVELKDFSEENNELEKEGFRKILILLNFLNYPDTNDKDILDEIESSAKVDLKIAKGLHHIKQERYGNSQEFSVSLSTRPNKAVLVAGSNLKELEDILEYTIDKEIDIYTHGEMILAHTYPKLREYSNLIGHFGVGVENCLLDFATFPGAILITKHAIDNIEYLYRGRLFTTDYFVPKGAIKVNEGDFSKLIDSAKKAKGFKKGKTRESIKVGVSEAEIISGLQRLFDNINKYKHIVILGPESHSNKNKLYFENIIHNMPADTFVISFSGHQSTENMMGLNGTSDFSLIYFILDKLSENNINKENTDISIFISKCDKHTISNIINLKGLGIKNVFLSKCTPMMLNPVLIDTLKNIYGIIPTSQPIDDLNIIVG